MESLQVRVGTGRWRDADPSREEGPLQSVLGSLRRSLAVPLIPSLFCGIDGR